jgi:tRNA(fMet)-specific endonuclease VapC
MTTEGLVLIDTSVWVSALRRGAPEKLTERVAEVLDEDRAATCGIIIAELLSGTKSRKEYDDLSADFGALHYLKTPEPIWHRISELGFKLRSKGLHIPTTDLLIAQIAIDSDCVLLHSDRHFEQIARHAPLRAKRLK